MKAYGVFAGGGVKGVALAGALSAANKNEINFVGYGGASAGAIIAYLSAIGYSGEKIYHKMLEYILQQMLFDDEGAELIELKKFMSDISGVPRSIKKLNSGGTSPKIVENVKGACLSTVDFLKALTKVGKTKKSIMTVINSFGLYDTEHLKRTLIAWTEDIEPSLLDHNKQISFFELFNKKNIDLRVISSNLISKRASVYTYKETPAFDVISAVCASASYPLLFNPHMDDQSILIDGGLSSNLPMFMFKEEIDKYNRPLYAFELYKENSTDIDEVTFLPYIGRLIDTALEASDHVISGMLNAKRVTIRVPDDIDTLDVQINKIDVMRLFYTGYISGRDFFDEDRTVKLMKASSGDVRDEALAMYGSKELFTTVLDAISLSATIENEDVRAWLYVPTSRSTIISIATSFNAIDKIHEWSSSDKSDAWTAWENKAETISESIDSNGFSRTRVSMPIFLEEDNLKFTQSNTSASTAVGVLVLDMDREPEDCLWLTLAKSRTVLHNLFRDELILPWQLVLSRMLSKTSY